MGKEETEEADAAAEYDKVTQANKVTKTTKDQDVKYKTQEFKTLDKEITELTSDKDTTGNELAAVLEYYGKLTDRFGQTRNLRRPKGTARGGDRWPERSALHFGKRNRFCATQASWWPPRHIRFLKGDVSRGVKK